MAEYDRVRPTHHGPPSAGWPGARLARGHHDLVRRDRLRLERRPDTLHLGWPSPRTSRTRVSASTSARWLPRLDTSPHSPPSSRSFKTPAPVPSDPLVDRHVRIAG